MKEMVLLAGNRRRLLRAAVVGGIGSVTGRSRRRAEADQVHEHQQDVRPDDGVTSRDELDPAKPDIRDG
jgi:hypothetical protein